MGNAIAAVIAVIVFIAGVVILGAGFGAADAVQPFTYIGGVMLITLSIGGPILLLDKLDR